MCLFIMATEYVGPKHRAMAGTFTWYFWTGALMFIALLAYLIRTGGNFPWSPLLQAFCCSSFGCKMYLN